MPSLHGPLMYPSFFSPQAGLRKTQHLSALTGLSWGEIGSLALWERGRSQCISPRIKQEWRLPSLYRKLGFLPAWFYFFWDNVHETTCTLRLLNQNTAKHKMGINFRRGETSLQRLQKINVSSTESEKKGRRKYTHTIKCLKDHTGSEKYRILIL